MRVTMTTPAQALAADTQARTMTGVVVPYGQPGNTSAGRLTVKAGAVRVPDNLRTVKLLRDHDRSRPVGYALASSDTADGLIMTFRIGATDDGNQALLEATEGLRDAFSVELDDLELDGQTITGADLTAVAQVPVPAYQAARIAQVAAARRATDQPDVHPTVDPPQPLPPEADPDGGDPDDDDDDTDDEHDPDTITTTPGEDPDMTTTATAASGPAASAARPTPTTGRPRGVTTVLEAAHVIAARARGQITTAELNAALSDVTTAPASAGAILQPMWVGNLWTDDPQPRIHVDAITGPRPLTGLTINGFVWSPGMTVAQWAGDKTAIPTSVPKAVIGTASAKRWAGGVDVAREFVDLGSAEIIADLLATARDDYRTKTDLDCLNYLVAGATDAGAAFTDGLSAITAVVGHFTGRGRLSSLFVGSDVWSSLAGNTSQSWLSGSVSFTGGDAGGVTFVLDGDLPPGGVLGLDKRAATFYEQGPITVEALNIAQGGIDEAVHGYTGTLINKPAYVVKATATITRAAGASSSSSSKK
jgi:hypothetical protein